MAAEEPQGPPQETAGGDADVTTTTKGGAQKQGRS